MYFVLSVKGALSIFTCKYIDRFTKHFQSK